MPRKRKKRRINRSRPNEASQSLVRRIAIPTLGWAILGLSVVIFTRPARLSKLFSDEVELWRLTLFFLVLIALSASMVTFNDWIRKRKN